VRIPALLLMASALTCVAGNVALVVGAPVLFAHAPPKAPANGLTQEFVSHEAAGAVFGHILGAWSNVVGRGPLPLALLTATILTVICVRQRRAASAAIVPTATAIACACHLWSASLQERMRELLEGLRAGTIEGSGWGRFQALHRQSEMALGIETIAMLAVAVWTGAMLAHVSGMLPPRPTLHSV
jgi:hypothetical protein